MWESLVWVVVAVMCLQVLLLLAKLVLAIRKYFCLRELNLSERYGQYTWVIITGPSSGQGRQFAHQWASRGFNLLLIGSERTRLVVSEINALYPDVQVQLIVKDFSDAHQDGFFDEIERAVTDLPGEVSVLINSVGHRVGWRPFHEMPAHKIRDTIVTGTIVQARLMHFMLPRLIQRQSGKRSLIVTITAQCIHPNLLLAGVSGNEISVPYLTIYEPTNAWGYFNMQSVIAEYGGQLDLLNVTPGAVVTENTRAALSDTIGAIDEVQYVRNIFRLMGHVNGETCAYWLHAALMIAINFAPWVKDAVLEATGEKIAAMYMRTYHAKVNEHRPQPNPLPLHTRFDSSYEAV